jgi:hypothetical protein
MILTPVRVTNTEFRNIIIHPSLRNAKIIGGVFLLPIVPDQGVNDQIFCRQLEPVRAHAVELEVISDPREKCLRQLIFPRSFRQCTNGTAVSVKQRLERRRIVKAYAVDVQEAYVRRAVISPKTIPAHWNFIFQRFHDHEF